MKRIRQTARRYERNKATSSSLRTKLKHFRAVAEADDSNGVGDLLNPTLSLVDKAVQKGVLHRNKANRIKSSLAKAANTASASA